MPCVAQYNDDRWYRAKVVDLPGEKQVTVIYVDYGNTETISCDRIRALQNSFYMLPQQVCMRERGAVNFIENLFMQLFKNSNAVVNLPTPFQVPVSICFFQAHCCSLEVPATMDPTDEFQVSI